MNGTMGLGQSLDYLGGGLKRSFQKPKTLEVVFTPPNLLFND